MKLSKLWCFVLLTVFASFAARPVSAHPMGNFSINHYARFEAKSGEVRLRYILDFAEIPTADRMAKLDTDGDGAINAVEKSAYLKTEATAFLQGLSVQVDAQKIVLMPQKSDLEVRAGAGGLPTLRIWVDSRIPLLANVKARVNYNDTNFQGRSGWMEIIAVADKGYAISNSNAATIDQSQSLTLFPIDAGIVPPHQTSASFSIEAIGSSAPDTTASVSPRSELGITTSATNNQTPQNRFTQSIAERNLTPALILWGLLFAFAFGAIHALSPGHGKTMVAAYLVGSRGTPRHAVLLGLVVTLTHTFGVFALGLVLLFASHFILPEKLFSTLGAVSGLLIFGVGLWLFMSRWQGVTGHYSHLHYDHTHSHDDHSHAGHFHAGHSHDDNAHADHDHGDQSHSHENEGYSNDGHSQASAAHTHSHGGISHSHTVPDGPVTMKTLIALGISGGIVPCPEALVVLLAAVKLHRIGYGMLLITAFSVGLAAALIAIGMLVVSTRKRLSRFDQFGEGSPLVRYLPVGSAALITLIGAALTLRAVVGTP